MNQTALAYEQLIGRFVKWTQTQPDIRAAIIVGSRARVDRPADEWADLDLVVIVTKPERYLSTPDWIKNIGDFWITHVESTATGDGLERRIPFEDGLDVDFSIVPVESVQQLVQDGQVADLIHRGIRVLLDKDGLTAQLMNLLPPVETLSPQPPSQREFLNVISDFLYHAVWTAKKLRRGELWTAKFCLDSYMIWNGTLTQHTVGIITPGLADVSWNNGHTLAPWKGYTMHLHTMTRTTSGALCWRQWICFDGWLYCQLRPSPSAQIRRGRIMRVLRGSNGATARFGPVSL